MSENEWLCPECDGSGIDSSHEAALYYANRGELSPCPRCDGSGQLAVHNPVAKRPMMTGIWPKKAGEDTIDLAERSERIVTDLQARLAEAEADADAGWQWAFWFDEWGGHQCTRTLSDEERVQFHADLARHKAIAQRGQP